MKKRIYSKGKNLASKRFVEVKITPQIKQPHQKPNSGCIIPGCMLSIFLGFIIIVILQTFGGQIKKPAIYLYPEQETNINIKLDNKIKLEIDIPKYVQLKGWNVKAYPNGKIVDLQPEYTNCDKLNSTQFGLEYAKSACKNNDYPYVYWDGIQTAKPIPTKNQGWIVDKKDLPDFLAEKLEYVGFNKAEKEEFLRYWTKKLSNNDKYFIYFLQGKDVDDYLPMQVTPKPDSINRFYILAKPVNSTKADLQPQKLDKFKRKGFTLVEWGGSVL